MFVNLHSFIILKAGHLDVYIHVIFQTYKFGDKILLTMDLIMIYGYTNVVLIHKNAQLKYESTIFSSFFFRKGFKKQVGALSPVIHLQQC